MAKKSKRYSAIMESFDKTQTYDVAEAVKNVRALLMRSSMRLLRCTFV